MPESRRISLCQTCSTPTPRGHTMPIPVTTTRRSSIVLKPVIWKLPSGGLLLLDVVDRILDGADLLGGILGDFDAEGFFESHDKLDRVEAVRAEIVDEGRFGSHLRLLHAQMFHHDLLHLVGDFAHGPRNSCLAAIDDNPNALGASAGPEHPPTFPTMHPGTAGRLARF